MTSTPARLEVAIEAGARKVFASALEWPGWSRAAKTEHEAIERLLDYAPRFAPVAQAAGLAFPQSFEAAVIERSTGGSGTDFGVPGPAPAADARPADEPGAARLVAIVAAAWTTFDAIAAGAPAELRKGPRGGGRDRDKMVNHVVEADWYYARELGLKARQPGPGDRVAVEASRAAVLVILGRPSDGEPLGGRTWTQRYAARRIAWHALDHAWEMQDRSD